MAPVLSVIIACRNAEATLGVQLEALAAQEGFSGPWEVLVCDNGSTDGTVALAESYRFRLPLRVVPAADRPGAAHARNAGAAASAAPWLAFVDADDEVAPGWLAAMTSALREHPFVAGRFEGTKLNSPQVARSRPLQQSTGLQDTWIGPRLPHAGAGNMGVHRSVFLAVGGFDETMASLEDTDFCWRVQLSGVPLVFVPQALLHVRLRASLRGMWRQGLAYGAACAELEHRYTGVSAPTGLPVGPVEVDTESGRRPGALGRALWVAAWHVGHRGWRPTDRPAPVTTVTRQAV